MKLKENGLPVQKEKLGVNCYPGQKIIHGEPVLLKYIIQYNNIYVL